MLGVERFASSAHAKKDLNELERMAQDELANVFSCLRMVVDPVNPERNNLIRFYASEYLRSVADKIDLALCRTDMVQYLHEQSLRRDGRDGGGLPEFPGEDLQELQEG